MKIKTRNEFIKINVLEAGLMRPADAARFMGLTQAGFHKCYMKRFHVFEYEGVRLISFLDVFSMALQRDINLINHVDEKELVRLRKEQKVVHVQRLDELRKHISS